MYCFNYEKIFNEVPNIEDTFSKEYLEFYRRHLLSDNYEKELDNFYSNNNLSINAIIFKYLNMEFSKFIEEKSIDSLERNYLNWRDNKNEDKVELFSDNFYFKILDCIINKIIDCLDKCENTNNCCNICLESEANLKCNKCTLLYHKDCLIKYILNNFKYYDDENDKLYHIINYEISCPQCRKHFLLDFKINPSKDSFSTLNNKNTSTNSKKL